MKKISLIILIMLIGVYTSLSAVEVTFVVKSESVSETEKVFIVGNSDEIGNWDPGKVEFDKTAHDTWKKTIDFKKGKRIEYKITRGTWEKEAMDKNDKIPGNSKLKVQEKETVVINVKNWKDQVSGASKNIQGQITGTVIEHDNMKGPGIVPRKVLVWLPPSYKKNKDKRYPVLYMHDGQQIFDPATTTHGIDWQIDETVTELIKSNKMKEIIVVGNYSTKDRTKEYSDGKKGAAYRNFVVNILKPFIDKKYRTLSDRDNTAIAGSSMGGIASFLLVFYNSETFSMAGCFSPAFWLDWIKIKKSNWPKRPVKIYIDNGGIGLERRLQPGCDLMLETLQLKGFKFGNDLLWYHDKEAEHNEEAWAKRAWRALLFMFGKGEQQWINELPEPPKPVYAEFDKKYKSKTILDKMIIVGVESDIESYQSFSDINDIWSDFYKIEKDIKHIKNPDNPTYIGIQKQPGFFSKKKYLAGVIVDKIEDLPEGCVVERIDKSDCVKLVYKDSLEKLNKSSNYLTEWFLPRNNLIKTEPVIEWYNKKRDPISDNQKVVIYVGYKPAD